MPTEEIVVKSLYKDVVYFTMTLSNLSSKAVVCFTITLSNLSSQGCSILYNDVVKSLFTRLLYTLQ